MLRRIDPEIVGAAVVDPATLAETKALFA
jgi:hypothetical protein